MTLPDPAKRTLRIYESQRQDSLAEQIRDVIEYAEMAGCYDAADWMKRKQRLERIAARGRDTAADFLRSMPTEGGGNGG